MSLTIQASLICGGSNGSNQSGTATGIVTVPAGQTLTLSWALRAVVEAQDDGFDVAELFLDGALQSQIGSQGNGQGCQVSGIQNIGDMVIGEGVHTIKVSYDTVDSQFHSDACGVQFITTGCENVVL